jgi:hypothetical protein
MSLGCSCLRHSPEDIIALAMSQHLDLLVKEWLRVVMYSFLTNEQPEAQKTRRVGWHLKVSRGPLFNPA